MKLMTKEIEKKLMKFPLESQVGKGEEAEVVVKYFYPYGAGTWLIIEGERQPDGDWELFGYCHIHEWEWGSVMLSELQGVRTRYGGIERDLYTGEHRTVKDLMKEVQI